MTAGWSIHIFEWSIVKSCIFARVIRNYLSSKIVFDLFIILNLWVEDSSENKILLEYLAVPELLNLESLFLPNANLCIAFLRIENIEFNSDLLIFLLFLKIAAFCLWLLKVQDESFIVDYLRRIFFRYKSWIDGISSWVLYSSIYDLDVCITNWLLKDLDEWNPDYLGFLGFVAKAPGTHNSSLLSEEASKDSFRFLGRRRTLIILCLDYFLASIKSKLL